MKEENETFSLADALALDKALEEQAAAEKLFVGFIGGTIMVLLSILLCVLTKL